MNKKILTGAVCALLCFGQGMAGNPFRAMKEAIAQANKEKKEAILAAIVEAEQSQAMTEIPGIYPMTEPRFEWSQGDTKEMKVVLEEKGLVIENKSDKTSALSIVELPLDAENDSFVYGIMFDKVKPDDEKRVGLILDFADNRNYKAIMIGRKMYSYVVSRDGVTSVVKTGLIKSGKGVSTLYISRTGDKIDIFLNGLESGQIKKVKMENNVFGILVEGKQKVAVPAFIFAMPDRNGEDTEVSTEVD